MADITIPNLRTPLTPAAAFLLRSLGELQGDIGMVRNLYLTRYAAFWNVSVQGVNAQGQPFQTNPNQPGAMTPAQKLAALGVHAAEYFALAAALRDTVNAAVLDPAQQVQSAPPGLRVVPTDGADPANGLKLQTQQQSQPDANGNITVSWVDVSAT